MEFALAALPYLVFLACPLMMVVCVVGMRKAGCSSSSATAQDTSGQPREARVAALEGQLAMIQTELQALRAAEDASATAEPSAGVGSLRTDHHPEVNHAARQSA